MANPKHIAVVQSGRAAIARWRQKNGRRLDLCEAKLIGVDLIGADLCGADLRNADLSRAKLGMAHFRYANLSKADFSKADLSSADLVEAKLNEAKFSYAILKMAILSRADLSKADLNGADLRTANLNEANLTSVNLKEANLGGAYISGAYLKMANLRRTVLSKAHLAEAQLSDANLCGANLSEANLSDAHFSRTNLSGADFNAATCYRNVFAEVDLSVAKNLEMAIHTGPSTVGMNTLFSSKGKIPEVFLRGCGLPPWEIEVSRLYTPGLSANEISERLSTKVFSALTEGPIYLGGVFISYSHVDSSFADKVRKELHKSGANVWLDRHDALAGDIDKQVTNAIRLQDILLLVLSKDSLASDWVWHEIELARKKEKDEGRDVLCPVALDESWKDYLGEQVLMRQVQKKNIIDFSGWKTKKFSTAFEKLTKGLKLNYEKRIRTA